MPNNVDKKLYRAKKDRIIAGVCGGLGEYFNIDSVLVRVVFILLAFANGFGILLYIILMIVLPSEPDTEKQAIVKPQPAIPAIREDKPLAQFVASPDQPSEPFYSPIAEPAPQKIQEPAKENVTKSAEEDAKAPAQKMVGSKRNMIGTAIIIIGLIMLLDNFLPIFSWISWKLILALVIILLGYLMVKN